jgi:hypothetical protein
MLTEFTQRTCMHLLTGGFGDADAICYHETPAAERQRDPEEHRSVTQEHEHEHEHACTYTPRTDTLYLKLATFIKNKPKN